MKPHDKEYVEWVKKNGAMRKGRQVASSHIYCTSLFSFIMVLLAFPKACQV
jgi:hypothetical protein